MSVKSITSDAIHNTKTIRAKGGYEVWSTAIEGTIEPETWLTRMGASRHREKLRKLYPAVEMIVVYVHYLQDPK